MGAGTGAGGVVLGGVNGDVAGAHGAHLIAAVLARRDHEGGVDAGGGGVVGAEGRWG